MHFGFIGLGKMGAPLARNLLRAGHRLTVFTRDPEKARAFADLGASVAQARPDLAACEVLCTCLPRPEHVAETVLGEEGLYARMEKGAIHVEFSTIDPGTALALARAAREKGLRYIQCPVGKTPEMAARGESPLFFGGDREAIEKLSPVFSRIGRPRDMGTVEAACAVKLLSNLIGMTNVAVLAEGLRIAKLAGMDLRRVLELLADTGARSFQMDVRGPAMADGDFTPRFALELTVKDLELGCRMAEDWGYVPELMETALKQYRRAAAQGLGREDSCAVMKTED